MRPDRPDWCQARTQAGFTLIEMLVVLAILGLLVGLVAARGPVRSAGLEMRMAAGTVAQALRLARTQAIARNHAVPVVFDTAGRTVRLGSGPARALPPGIALAITATLDQSAGRLSAIQFLPDGSASGGQVELSGRGQTALVGVDWLTGRVTVLP